MPDPLWVPEITIGIVGLVVLGCGLAFLGYALTTWHK